MVFVLLLSLLFSGCYKSSSPAPTMPLVKIETSTTCTKQINNVSEANRSQIEKCYLKRLRENPLLKGRVVIYLWINEQGVPENIRIKTNMDDPTLEKCITKKAQNWIFPPDCSTPAEFPFFLNP